MCALDMSELGRRGENAIYQISNKRIATGCHTHTLMFESSVLERERDIYIYIERER